MKRSRSSRSTRNHGWSCTPRNCGTTRDAVTLELSGPSGDKALSSPSGLADLDRVPCHQLVDESALALRRSQQSSDPLHVLALTERTAHHDGHIGIGNVDPFIENP